MSGSEIAAPLLLGGNALEEGLKRRLEMRLVVDDERVFSNEAGVQGLRLESTAVRRKQKTTADHVHGAEHDGGTRRVDAPLGVVGELPA